MEIPLVPHRAEFPGAAVRRLAPATSAWTLALTSCLAVGAWLVAAPTPAAAQRTVREVQVPVAPALGIDEIDAGLREDLGLFPEVDGFVAARLFEISDGTCVLEITARVEGRTVRERRTVWTSDLEALRERISNGLAARGMVRAVRSDGRGGLVLAETLLGLGFYGWAVPATLDIDSSRGALAAYLLTAAASFYVPYRLTRTITVTDAHRDAVVWGGTRGILYGMLLADALTLGDDDSLLPPGEAEVDESHDDRIIFGLGLAASIGGSVLGYQVVDPARHDRGDVALWSTAGDFAAAYGFGTAVTLGLYDGGTTCRGDQCETQDLESTTAGHLTTVGLGLAGLWGARKWSEAEDYTVGDARALLSFGLLGGQLALPAAWALFEDANGGGKGVSASLIAGSAAGLFLGNRHLRGRSLSPGDGLLIQAGHLAGGLLAAGVTYLVDQGDQADELVYMTTSALGSAAGSLLTFRAVAARRPAGQRDPGRTGGPSIELNTAGLWTSLLSRDAARPVRVPLVTIHH